MTISKRHEIKHLTNLHTFFKQKAGKRFGMFPACCSLEIFLLRNLYGYGKLTFGIDVVYNSIQGATVRMEYLRQTIGSAKLSGIFDLPLMLRDKRVEVIILPAEDNSSEAQKPKRKLGFVKLPPLPESFFDPLPEDEIKAWGL